MAVAPGDREPQQIGCVPMEIDGDRSTRDDTSRHGWKNDDRCGSMPTKDRTTLSMKCERTIQGLRASLQGIGFVPIEVKEGIGFVPIEEEKDEAIGVNRINTSCQRRVRL